MSCYFIAHIRIHDPQEYEKYLESCDEVFAKYRGEYLAVDEHPKVLEGSEHAERIVLIRFPDQDAFDRWYRSPEYQEILRYRLHAAHCDTVLVQGLDGEPILS